MKISVIAPVKNEFPWIGYSVEAALPFVHEFIYSVSPGTDGTEELLEHLKAKHPGKIKTIPFADFKPLDQKAYNDAFNVCIEEASGDACWFLHPDMLVTRGAELKEGPLAWWTDMTSYAGDFQTRITKGRETRWKNIHAKKFGLHYFGGYGSQNEDFYHSDITGSAYKHYGTEFDKYPFEVASSGISVNHYCELKSYKRRLEKMKLCLKTQHPKGEERYIEELAVNHPRVTLELSSPLFGRFEFEKTQESVPDVIRLHEDEFKKFAKGDSNGQSVHLYATSSR